MGDIPIEVQFESQESMRMKGGTNLALGEFWELIVEGQMLRKVSSNIDCITLNRSMIRLLLMILVGL